MYKRLCKPLLSKSFFLFGSRGTGKSTLLKTLFKDKNILTLDLLDEELCSQLIAHPSRFLDIVTQNKKQYEWIVVDEVQKAPALLNYIQKLIVEKKQKFALTGSSARKLKRGSANLLGGRALMNSLFPLTHQELGKDFDLQKTLSLGSLPEVVLAETEEEAKDTLRTYASTYLKEEIVAEQIIRNLVPFRRFLEVAAQCNGQPINASKMGRDCGVDDTAIHRYFEILEETLVGILLLPYQTSVRKRQTKRSKFYFFDLGIKRALDHSLRNQLQEGTYAYGAAFEHLVILELMRLNHYLKLDYRFSYLQTKDNFEVDLVIERPGKPLTLVEIKSSKSVDETEINKLERFSKEFKNCEAIILCQESISRQHGKVRLYPWKEGIEAIVGI